MASNTRSGVATYIIGVIILVAALLLEFFYTGSPGRLAIGVSTLLFGFGIWAMAARPVFFRNLGIETANSEIAAAQGLVIVLLVSAILLIVGFLNLMGALPWWS